MVVYNRTIYGKIITNYFTSSGTSPSADGWEMPPGPVIDWRTPRAPLNNFTQSYARKYIQTRYNNLQFTRGCATIKYFHVLGKPFPTVGVDPCQVRSRQGRPELHHTKHYTDCFQCTRKLYFKNYKQTLQNGIHEQNIPWGQLAPSGKACPSKEYRWRNPREMANSEDWPLLITITTQQVIFPRESYQGLDTYVVGACHLLWP